MNNNCLDRYFHLLSKRKARAVNRDRKKRLVCAVSQTLKKRRPLAVSRDLKSGGRALCPSPIFLERRIVETLKIYRVSDKYVHYLKSKDPRVQDNKGRRRPYVGVVLFMGAYQYFVPMESPKPNHENIKPGHHIMKIEEGRLGLLGFNNMIPIPDCALIRFNIDEEPDPKYAELLRRQASYINRKKADVLNHAAQTYFQVVRKKNKFLLRICCDFQKLEHACDQYDPNR